LEKFKVKVKSALGSKISIFVRALDFKSYDFSATVEFKKKVILKSNIFIQLAN